MGIRHFIGSSISQTTFYNTVTYTKPKRLLYFSVGEWAERFGEELWELGQRMTKSSEIKAVFIQSIIIVSNITKTKLSN